MKLSIIIVNYNVTKLLGECLASIAKFSEGIPYEVIVYDNNSTDVSWKTLIPQFPNVKFIASDQNKGFAVANNRAIDLAKGEYVLLLNPDTLIIEPIFKTLLDFADQHPKMGCLGVRFEDGNRKFLPESKRSVPDLKNSFEKLFFPLKQKNEKHYYRDDIKEDEIAEVDVITGAFMLMRKEVYQQVGGLDEAYFMYGEDIDICFSLKNIGLQNYYYGAKTIIHYKGESTIKDKVYLKRFYGAMQIFLDKYYKSQKPAEYQLLSAGLKVKHAMALLALRRRKLLHK